MPAPSHSTPSIEHIRWTGRQPYFLLALLITAILIASWFVASIAPPDSTEWFHVLLIGVVVALGFTVIWGIKQMHHELGSHLNMEAALRQAATFRQALEASSAGGLRARDNEGRITYVSPAFCRMTGFDKEEILGTRFPTVPYWDPLQAERNLETFDRAMNGSVSSNGLEVSMRRKNGESFDALVIESPFIDASGRHIGWLGAVIDITEQKRLRERNRQQYERLQANARLITMGEMASAMAHELSQPLAAISSYVAGCLNQLDSGGHNIPELKEIQQKIARQAQRAAGIISRVHGFVRRTEPNFSSADLNALVQEAITLIETSAIKQKTRISLDIQENLPPITIDVQMIEQVIVNLLRNGIDAMDDIPPEKRLITVSTSVHDRCVSLRIADQGCGISSEIVPHLFEPFFTTKGKGMGMGLNICRTIIELHHGLLAFEPNPSGGTIFTLTLQANTSYPEQE